MVASFIPSVLDDLDDAGITSPESGQVIRRNNVGLWVNDRLAHADLSNIGANTHAEIDTYITNIITALDGKAAISHNQAWSTITSTPTTRSGYGITDAEAAGAVNDHAALQNRILI